MKGYKLKTKTFVGDDEKKIVKQFYDFIKKNGYNGCMLAGFNSASFDDILMESRFIKYNFDESKLFGSRYDNIDIRLLLNSDPKAKGTLDDYLKFFNIGSKFNGYNGASVQNLYNENNWDHIKKYVKEDARLEALLLERVLKHKKKKYDISNILVYDIEVVLPEENMDLPELISEKDWTQDNLSKLREKYAKEETVQKHFSKLNYQDEVEKHKEECEKEIKKGIFNLFLNKIVAIGVAYWEEIKEEETF